MQPLNKSQLITELREITQAGMKDCSDALKEAGYDLQKAIDIIKTKGKNIVSGRTGKVASEGLIAISPFASGFAMVEVNCQTDFVANSIDFKNYTSNVAEEIVHSTILNEPFNPGVGYIEEARTNLVSRTKENIVVRRWWVQEAINPLAVVVEYLHSNAKIGVLMTILVSNENMLNNKETFSVAEGLAMQVAAMNPTSVSPSNLPADIVNRQKNIFENQLRELNKPEASWSKILDGKFNKWHTEVCLLNQESIMVSKKTVKEYLADIGKTLGGEITVVNFIRCQVGEGIDKPQEDFADEVNKVCGVNVQ